MKKLAGKLKVRHFDQSQKLQQLEAYDRTREREIHERNTKPPILTDRSSKSTMATSQLSISQ